MRIHPPFSDAHASVTFCEDPLFRFSGQPLPKTAASRMSISPRCFPDSAGFAGQLSKIDCRRRSAGNACEVSEVWQQTDSDIRTAFTLHPSTTALSESSVEETNLRTITTLLMSSQLPQFEAHHTRLRGGCALAPASNTLPKLRHLLPVCPPHQSSDNPTTTATSDRILNVHSAWHHRAATTDGAFNAQ